MLGFRSEKGCLRSFRRVGHFQGFNFFQLARLADKAEGHIGNIDIIDRKLQKVGNVEDIQISADRSSMMIQAECRAASLTGAYGSESEANTADNLTLSLHDAEAQLTSAWADRLGIPEKGTIENYIDAITEEDAPLVRRVLSSPDMPSLHTLWYRLVSPSGRVIPVCHVIQVVDSEDGKQICGSITECDYRDLKKVKLASLAIEHRVRAIGNETVEPGSRVSLQNILNLVEDCLAEENLEKEIIFTASSDALALTLEGFKPSSHELLALEDRDFSLRRVGESSSWKKLFHLADEEGYKLTASVNTNSQLQLTLKLKDLP